MLSDFHLIPLECPDCRRPLEAGEVSAVFFCLYCQKAYEPAKGTKKFNSYLLTFADSPAAGALRQSPPYYLPFWIIEAQIELIGRQYTRLDPELEYWLKFSSTLPHSSPEADKKSTGAPLLKLRLFVPAFPTTNVAAYTTNLGVSLTKAQPAFEARLEAPLQGNGEPVRPLPCIYNAEEAVALAEIIFTAMETREISNLLRIEFKLKPLIQDLWVLPFCLQDNFLVEPQTGAKMLAAGLEESGRQ